MPCRLAQQWMTLSDLEWPFYSSSVPPVCEGHAVTVGPVWLCVSCWFYQFMTTWNSTSDEVKCFISLCALVLSSSVDGSLGKLWHFQRLHRWGVVMQSVASVCLSVCLLRSWSNVWNTWPINFIFVVQLHFRTSRSRPSFKVKVTVAKNVIYWHN